MKKSLSNVTYLPSGNNEGKEKEEVVEENTLTQGYGSQPPGAVPLPGIFISRYDPSDVDECDGGSLYGDKAPRERSESYSAGGTRCTLMVGRPGAGSSCSSSAGLFASQRSLPWSSRCSSRLGVGDSGWDGDVSHDGSQSTMWRRDWTGGPHWTGGPCGDVVERTVTAYSSMNFFLPFSVQRRHSVSTAERTLGKTSTSTFDGQRETVAQLEDDRTSRQVSVKSKTPGDDDETQSQSLRVARDVQLSISSSRSLSEIESAVLKVIVDDEDSDTTAGQRRRPLTTPIKRRALRQRKALNSRRAEMTTIWINHHRHQHTDDSEVERRVERLLYEIDHSVTDSVDESKIQSQEFEMMSD